MCEVLAGAWETVGPLTIILSRAGRWVLRTPDQGREVPAPGKGCTRPGSVRSEVLSSLLGGRGPNVGIKVFGDPIPSLWLSPSHHQVIP